MIRRSDYCGMRVEEVFMSSRVCMSNNMFLLVSSATNKFRTSSSDSGTRNSPVELPVLPVRLTLCYGDFDLLLRHFDFLFLYLQLVA